MPKRSHQTSAASGWTGLIFQQISKSLRRCDGVRCPRLLLPGSFQRFQKAMRGSARYFVTSSSHIA